MKALLFIIMTGGILLTASCGKQNSTSRTHNSHRLETQVVRIDCTPCLLSVVSRSDVKGTMGIQTNHSQVTFSYGNGNDVVIDPSQIFVKGTLWGEIPDKTQKVLIQYYDSKFKVQLDPE